MAVNNFFITGLPRSRTAWMAAYLTTRDTLCFHDGLALCRNKAEYDQLMSEPLDGIANIGNADSGLVLFDFQAFWPGVPTVIIHRSPVQVAASLTRIYQVEPIIDMVNEKAYQLESLVGYHVQFDQLDMHLERICEFIGVTYDYYKHLMFRALNIQTNNLFVDEYHPFWEEEQA